MVKEGEPRQFKSNLIQRFIAGRLKAAEVNYEVVRVENLNRVRELLEQGASASLELNHPAYADYPTLAAIVLKEGIDDLMPRSRLVMSDKYSNNPLLGIPIRAIGWSFGLEFVSVKSHRFGGSKKNPRMNEEAMKKIQEETAGTIAVNAPEGTHSPSGEMQSARWGSYIWRQGRDYIVPIGVRKTEDQWPEGLGKIFYYIRKGRKDHQATVIVGEPVPVEYMERVAEVYAQGDEDEFIKHRVDFPMLLVANLHREYVRERGLEYNPEETKYTKGYYDDLSQELGEHPASVSLRDLRRMGEYTVKLRKATQQKSAREDKRIAPKPALRLNPELL